MTHRYTRLPPVLLLTILSTLSFISCKRSDSENLKSLQVKGSDTMVNLGQAWAEDYMKTHPGYSIAVTGGGSGTGITALLSNTCDIAEVSREMKSAEMELSKKKGITPKMYKVALDGLAVVVHPSNPVSQLTIDQIADIYTGKITNWKEVGGNDGKIVLLSREVNSGTHVYFKEHVLRKGDATSKVEFSSQALLLPSSQAISDEVAQNVNTIGYLGMGYISKKEKAVHVAKDASAPYVAPTIESVIANTYPISRPLLMYTKGEPTGLTKAFIEYILSPAGQQVVKKLDFVPVVGN